MTRALVTGGAGFIGSHVVDELHAEGSEVWVIDNLMNGKREHIPDVDDSHFFQVDITDAAAMAEALRKIRPQQVYHLAAIHFIPYCNAHPVEAFQTNAMGTKVLLQQLEQIGDVEGLFFASTAAVYPPKEEEHLESDTVYPMDPYGLSKLCGEEMVQLFLRRKNLHGVVGRLFNAVGPRETNPHLLPDIVDQLKAGKRTIVLGNLEPKRDFLHVRDMGRAIVTATTKTVGVETFNIGSCQQYSVLEVVKSCEQVLGEKIEIKQREDLIRKVDRPFLLAGIQKIQAQVGWKPEIDLQATLGELLS